MRTGMRLESLWESTISIKKMLKDNGAILTKIFNIPFDLERELAAILKAKKKLTKPKLIKLELLPKLCERPKFFESKKP